VDYQFKTGDTRPVIEERLDVEERLTETGTTVTFTLVPIEGRSQAVIKGATATIEGDETVSYELDSSDTSEAGEYFATFEVQYADGGVETFPKSRYYYIRVSEDL